VAETRQYLNPGGAYVNEATNLSEYLNPGGAYVNETTEPAAPGGGIPTLVGPRFGLAGSRGLAA
jgi:hypothetical protein